MSSVFFQWIDDAGCLVRGKHQGKKIEDVAGEDPGYLRWCLDNVESISEEDREVIRTALHFRRRRPF